MTSYDDFKKATWTAVVAAALSLGLCLPASASLIGDTITITSEANFPVVDIWSDTVMVGAGNELDGNVPGTEHVTPTMGQSFAALFPGDFIDVGANSITINYAPLGTLFGFNYAFITDYLDLDWLPTAGTLQNVTLAAGAMGLVGGVNISMITPNSFQLQATVDLVTGANFTLDLIAVHGQVPEPATLPLFVAGLMGLMYTLRRRRKV